MWERIKKAGKKYINDVVTLIGATSLGWLYTIFRRTFDWCDPRTSGKCNEIISRDANYVSIGGCYFDFIVRTGVKCIKVSNGSICGINRANVGKVKNTLDFIIDFESMFAFYLQMFLFFYTENAISKGADPHNVPIEDDDFGWVCGMAVVLALSSHARLREFLIRPGAFHKIMNGVFGSLRGLADMRGFVAAIESIIDMKRGTDSATYSRLGQFFRYGFAVPWGIAAGVTSAKYGSNQPIAVLFDRTISSRWGNVVLFIDNLAATFLFGYLLVHNLEDTESPHKEIQWALFSLLFLLPLFRHCLMKRWDVQAIDSDDSDTPDNDAENEEAAGNEPYITFNDDQDKGEKDEPKKKNEKDEVEKRATEPQPSTLSRFSWKNTPFQLFRNKNVTSYVVSYKQRQQKHAIVQGAEFQRETRSSKPERQSFPPAEKMQEYKEINAERPVENTF